MRAEYDMNELTLKFSVYPNDLFEGMPEHVRMELIESLSCDDGVIQHVADQILKGSTESGYHGSIGSPSLHPKGIEYAQRLLAKHHGDLVKTVIDDLEKDLARKQKTINALNSELISFRERRR